MNQFSNANESPVSQFRAPPADSTMRKLIRSKATMDFLTKDGAWTRDMASAEAFGNYTATAAAKSQFSLQEVKVYYSFAGPRQSEWDFAVTL